MDKIRINPEVSLTMWCAAYVVETERWRSEKRQTLLHVVLWLKNGTGVHLTYWEDGTTNASTVRRTAVDGVRAPYVNDKILPLGKTADIGTVELLRVLQALNLLGPIMTRSHRLNTLGQIMTEATRSGNHFFSQEGIRAMQQTQARTVYPTFGPHGSFFVTGEIARPGQKRKYTVRRAWLKVEDNPTIPLLHIENASGFQEFHRVGMAISDAQTRARDLRAVYSYRADPQVTSPFAKLDEAQKD